MVNRAASAFEIDLPGWVALTTTTIFVFSPAMMSTGLTPVLSPKRKRKPSESDCHSPSASPTSTVSIASFQEARLREEDELGRYSPRAAVAGRFRELAIRGERSSNKENSRSDLQQEASTAPAQRLCTFETPRDLDTISEPPLVDGSHAQYDQNHLGETPTNQSAGDESLAPTTPVARKMALPSSRKQRSPTSVSKERKNRLSPPLPGTSPEDPLVWHDSEITGHNPSDPSDDGYGINGIGFKPTAAIAWARSQKRHQQVAEWKSREAREAREKRRQRRQEGTDMEDKFRSIHKGAIQKRVKFDV